MFRRARRAFVLFFLTDRKFRLIGKVLYMRRKILWRIVENFCEYCIERLENILKGLTMLIK